MLDLKSTAHRPASDQASGAPAYWGAVQDWLVIGPFSPADPAKPLNDDFLKEAEVQPGENEKLGDKTWKMVAACGNMLNIDPAFPNAAPGSVAYAHAYLYSPAGALIEFRFATTNTLGMKAFINNALAFDTAKPSQVRVKLAAGWNRILVKVARGDEKKQYCNEFHLSTWKFVCYFHAANPAEMQETNIRWITRLPADGASGPIVVGDKVLMTSEPWDVVCVNRENGRIQWVRSNHYFDAMSDEERRNPALKDVATAAAQLTLINDCFATPEGATDAQRREKVELEKKIATLLAQADPKLKLPTQNNHAGHAVPTAVSDGKRVYAWYGFGLAACYDLDGNRVWIRRENEKYGNAEHGRNSSPALAGGTLFTHLADVIGFDAQTGTVKWRFERPDRPTHQSILPLKINGKETAFLGNTLFDAGGNVLWTDKRWFAAAICPTAVIDGNTLYQIADGAATVQVGKLMPDEKISGPESFKLFPGTGNPYNKRAIIASPLSQSGLLYTVDFTGELRVFDTKDFKLVYAKNFGCPEVNSRYHALGAFYASPYLIGDNIYLPSLTGTTFVIKSGPTFELVSVNKIECDDSGSKSFGRPELFASSPFAAGKQLFIRGTRHLYCIEQK